MVAGLLHTEACAGVFGFFIALSTSSPLSVVTTEAGAGAASAWTVRDVEAVTVAAAAAATVAVAGGGGGAVTAVTAVTDAGGGAVTAVTAVAVAVTGGGGAVTAVAGGDTLSSSLATEESSVQGDEACAGAAETEEGAGACGSGEQLALSRGSVAALATACVVHFVGSPAGAVIAFLADVTVVFCATTVDCLWVLLSWPRPSSFSASSSSSSLSLEEELE